MYSQYLLFIYFQYLFHYSCRHLRHIVFLFFSIAEKGQENCADLIEAHLQCMRKEGFNI